MAPPRDAENGYIGYKIYRTNCLPLDSLGLGNMRNLSYCPIVGQIFIKNVQTVLCPTVQWLDSAVFNCQNVGQCSVKLSNGWTLLCPTVLWLVNVVSKCPMAGELSVQ